MVFAYGSKLCIFIVYLNTQFHCSGTQDVKQLHIVFRHGDRNPTETYKNDPYRNYSWPGGWGQLTNLGKLQMYNLGLKIRKLYSNFIPDLFYPDFNNIRSSYSDRCLMSAEAFLAGLYPPKNGQIWSKDLLWQPIPISYLPREQDNLIAMKAPCPKYDSEFEKVQTSPEIQRINRDNAELFKYLTENTGQLYNNINEVEFLYNTLEIEMFNNLTLPEWMKNMSMPHLKMLAARSLETYTETDFMKRMKGGVFFREVLTAMKFNKGPSLFLYSAHDISLVNIIRATGFQKTYKPGYGASFIAELRNNSQVHLFYRDDIEATREEILLDKCTNCTLDQFEDILRPMLPVNWTQECLA